jgi:ribosome assembly protein YihI (activator of Der GTPase)
MNGLDPYAYMQQVSAELERLGPEQLNTVLDELEYLFEVIPPELQDLADGLMERVRHRLGQLG